jgi:hypothetical protein
MEDSENGGKGDFGGHQPARQDGDAAGMSLKRSVERGAAAVQARQHFTPAAAV